MSGKVSPAFEPFLEGSGPNDKCDAIVIYRTPSDDNPPPMSELREVDRRLEYVRERAAAQRAVEQEVFGTYQRAGAQRTRGRRDLAYTSIGASTLPVATVEVTRSTLPSLARQPDVVAIMPNQKISLIEPRRVSFVELSKQEYRNGLTWGLQQLDIPRLWERTQGQGINVAVLDTGVYSEHPALDERVQEFVVIDPLGRRIAAHPAFDGSIHGTHVCGTIAGGQTEEGVAIGVAPRVNLLVAGVLLGDATLATLVEGLAWAVEKGADIINMSLGFTYYEPHFTQVFDLLIHQYGIMPVVAIGNENHGNSSSPGNAHNAFSVGAVESTGAGKVDVAFFSSGASLVFPGREPGVVTKPDVVAPGAQIYSCVPPDKQPDRTYIYAYLDGSSMAAPHVTGTAALLMAAVPDAPITDVMEALRVTAKHPAGSAKRPDNRWGYGVIQPMEALKILG
jgi:subtilisin family serine protease